ncbi:MAG TPA: ABC transporter permease [Gemmatimonadales bacterium]|nr:ABC transporter permease [Gemmatimonadales bacterium]
MEALLQDLRYAVRQLAKSPAFTAVAVLTLAVGIGANTAIFSAVHTVLLKPLPFPDSDRLVEVLSTGFQNVRFGVSYPDLESLRGMTQDFSAVGASSRQQYNLTGAGDPQEVQAASVTADLFTTLQVHPEVGALFTAAEERSPVALVSHGLWVTSFGSDPGIVGKAIALDGKSYTVIGVMPAGFHFPDRSIQVWTPIGDALAQIPQAETNRGFHFLSAVARLKPGVTLARVTGDLAVIADRLNAADSAADAASGTVRRQIVASGGGPGPRPGGGPRASSPFSNGFHATFLHEAAIGDARRPLFIMLGAVGVVLLIACANAANLLLARAVARRREMAIRQALGAARGRLVRQLLTESVLLALAAALVGILLAGWGLRALITIWPNALPNAREIALDGPVLAFTVGLALLTGLAFGLVPAWRASAPGIEEALRDEAAAATGGRRRRLQGGLVVGEVALALVLLVGAGLLVRSFIRLSSVNPGYDTRNLLAARIRLTPARYPNEAGQAQFFANVLGALAARPGVQYASIAGTLPLSGSVRMVAFDPRTVRPDFPEPFMALRSFAVSPDYFSAFRVPIRRGRAFSADDRAGGPPVGIMNRAAVDQLWPGQDPVGKQLTLGGPRSPGGGAPMTIVGVIDNLRSTSLDAEPQPEIYTPVAQDADLSQMWVVLRAANGRPLQLASAIRDAVRQADPEQPIGEMASLSEMADRLTAARRFNTTLLTLFACLAVVLALVGIYGVTAYAVSQRAREMGIRMALGAQPGQVVGLLMRENLRRVALGVALGLAASFGVTRVLRALLFEVTPSDAVTFAATALLLAVVALVATWWPARRATRVDPVVALRTE